MFNMGHMTRPRPEILSDGARCPEIGLGSQGLHHVFMVLQGFEGLVKVCCNAVSSRIKIRPPQNPLSIFRSFNQASEESSRSRAGLRTNEGLLGIRV